MRHVCLSLSECDAIQPIIHRNLTNDEIMSQQYQWLRVKSHQPLTRVIEFKSIEYYNGNRQMNSRPCCKERLARSFLWQVHATLSKVTLPLFVVPSHNSWWGDFNTIMLVLRIPTSPSAILQTLNIYINWKKNHFSHQSQFIQGIFPDI